MRWIAASIVLALALALAGCGGLERQSYPASAQDVVMIGQVTHVQPFKGETSESDWSRAGWGTLAGGVVAGAVAGLADSDIDTYDAYSYVIKPSHDAARVFNSYARVQKDECVAVYQAVKPRVHSLSVLSLDRCQH